MTQTEALKLALEALIGARAFLESDAPVEIWSVNDKAITAIKAALAQPTSGDYALGYAEGFNDACMPKPAQQEPVAWMHTKLDGVVVSHRPADLDRHPDRWKALYKNTPPCSTCEALARTVMLDQTSHDATPPQRKPLTGKEIDSFREANSEGRGAGWRFNFEGFARAIEAAHGIKE